MPRKKILFIQRQPPGLAAREALESALTAGVFEQQVAVLFRDHGVLQLSVPAGEAEEESSELTLAEAVAALPDYGIDSVFACTRSLRAHGLADAALILPARPLDLHAQAALIAGQDMVLTD